MTAATPHVFVKHLSDHREFIAARVLKDVLLEHRFEASRHWGLRVYLIAHIAKFGVLTREGEQHQAFKELVQLKTLVTRLLQPNTIGSDFKGLECNRF